MSINKVVVIGGGTMGLDIAAGLLPAAASRSLSATSTIS